MIFILFISMFFNAFSINRTEVKSNDKQILKLLSSGEYGGPNLNVSGVEEEGEIILEIEAKIDNLSSGLGRVKKIQISYETFNNKIESSENNSLICRVQKGISFIKYNSLGKSFFKDIDLYKIASKGVSIHNEGLVKRFSDTFVLPNKKDGEKSSFFFSSDRFGREKVIDIDDLNEKAKLLFNIEGDLSVTSSKDIYKFFIPITIPKGAMQHNLRHKISFKMKIFFDSDVEEYSHDFVYGNRSNNVLGNKMIIVTDSHEAEYELCLKDSFEEYSNILYNSSLHAPDLYILNKNLKNKKIWCFELDSNELQEDYEIETKDGESSISTMSEGDNVSFKSYIVNIYSSINKKKGNRVLISSMTIDLYIININRYVAPVFTQYSPKYLEYEGKYYGMKDIYEIESINSDLEINLGSVNLFNSELNYKMVNNSQINILSSSLSNIYENSIENKSYTFVDQKEMKMKVSKENIKFNTSNIEVVESIENGKRKISLKGLKVVIEGEEFDLDKYNGAIVKDIKTDLNITYPEVVSVEYYITYEIRNWYFLEYIENKIIDIDYKLEIPFENDISIFPLIKRKDGDKYIGRPLFIERGFYKKNEHNYIFSMHKEDFASLNIRWISDKLDDIPIDLDLNRKVLDKIKYVNFNGPLSFCRKMNYKYGRSEKYYLEKSPIVEFNNRVGKISFNDEEIAKIDCRKVIFADNFNNFFVNKPIIQEISELKIKEEDMNFYSGVYDQSHEVDIWCNHIEHKSGKALASDDNWFCISRSFLFTKQSFYIDNIFFTKKGGDYSAKIDFEGIILKKPSIFTKSNRSFDKNMVCKVTFTDNIDDLNKSDKKVDINKSDNTTLSIFNNKNSKNLTIPFEVTLIKNICTSFSRRNIENISKKKCDNTTHLLDEDGILKEYEDEKGSNICFLELSDQDKTNNRYIDRSSPVGFKLGYRVDVLTNDNPISEEKEKEYLSSKKYYEDKNSKIIYLEGGIKSPKDIFSNRVVTKGKDVDFKEDMKMDYSIESSNVSPTSFSFNLPKDIFNIKFPYSLIAHKLSIFIFPYEQNAGKWSNIESEINIEYRDKVESEKVECIELDDDILKEKSAFKRDKDIFEHPEAQLFIDNKKYIASQGRSNIKAGFSYRYDEKLESGGFTFKKGVSLNSFVGNEKKPLKLFDKSIECSVNPGLYIESFKIFNDKGEEILSLGRDFMQQLISLGDKNLDELEIRVNSEYAFIDIVFNKDLKRYTLISEDEEFKIDIHMRYFKKDIYLPAEIDLKNIFISPSVLGEKVFFEMEGAMLIDDDNRLKVDGIRTNSTLITTKIRGSK